MAIKQGDRICSKVLTTDRKDAGTRSVDEMHIHRPPFATEVIRGYDLPNCMVLDTGNSNRGKNVLHIYYDREQQQPEVSEELLFRGRPLLRVMWVVGVIAVLDILIRL